MAFFKAVCAKNNQKIELMVQFGDIEEAREYLHKEGYSIIEIKETSDNNYDAGVFYFDANIGGVVKSGQIHSDDIFKAYVKLVDGLGYNVIYIYDSKEREEKEKIIITQKLKNSYKIYKESTEKNKESTEKNKNLGTKEEKQAAQEKKEKDDLSVFLVKEINYYYSLIDKVLDKIDFILNNYNNEINSERKSKLNDLYNGLKQMKNITNTKKLKAIGELSLVKIGELQQEFINNNILDTKKDILKETNELLKKFGSSKQIVMPEDDIKLKINNLIKEYSELIKNFFKPGVKKEKIDKNSGRYFDILREKNIYKNKLSDINKEIYKSFFNREKYKRLTLKKKLILQNITLLDNRIKNKKISYTKTIKGIYYYKDVIIYLIQKLGDLFIYALFLYSVFFILVNILVDHKLITTNLNYYFIQYIVIFCVLALLLKISKNLTLLVVNSFIYTVFCLYLLINF